MDQSSGSHSHTKNINSNQYFIKTFGCKSNIYDSQMLETELMNRGWVRAEHEAEATLIIINSCTVTQEADRQSKKMAQKMAMIYPQAKIAITGCAAEVEHESYAKIPGVSFVVGNKNKPQMIESILSLAQSTFSTSSSSNEWASADKICGWVKKVNTTRGFLKIQEGCNRHCSYCIIPQGRGPARSQDMTQALQQAIEFESLGIKELMLTGTNLGAYSPSLSLLLRELLKETKNIRFRIGSLSPPEITPDLLDLVTHEERICSHLHVSLQSTQNEVLSKMNRNYSIKVIERVLSSISKIKKEVGGIFVGMDLITGFPQESDSQFKEGLQNLKDLPWQRLHVFPYSVRQGTAAALLPDHVNQSVKLTRAAELRALSLARLTDHYTSVLHLTQNSAEGIHGILPEATTPVSGYSSNYLRMIFPANTQIQVNEWGTARPKTIKVDPIAGDVAFLCNEG